VLIYGGLSVRMHVFLTTKSWENTCQEDHIKII